MTLVEHKISNQGTCMCDNSRGDNRKSFTMHIYNILMITIKPAIHEATLLPATVAGNDVEICLFTSNYCRQHSTTYVCVYHTRGNFVVSNKAASCMARLYMFVTLSRNHTSLALLHDSTQAPPTSAGSSLSMSSGPLCASRNMRSTSRRTAREPSCLRCLHRCS